MGKLHQHELSSSARTHFICITECMRRVRSACPCRSLYVVRPRTRCGCVRSASLQLLRVVWLVRGESAEQLSDIVGVAIHCSGWSRHCSTTSRPPYTPASMCYDGFSCFEVLVPVLARHSVLILSFTGHRHVSAILRRPITPGWLTDWVQLRLRRGGVLTTWGD